MKVAKVSFTFSVKICMKTRIYDADLPALISLDSFNTIRITKRGDDYVFSSSGYNNKAEAEKAGAELCNILTALGALNNLGIDVPINRRPNAKDKKVNQKLHDGEFDLTIYGGGQLAPMTVQAHGYISIYMHQLEEQLATYARTCGQLEPRQLTCAALLNDAFYAGRPEAVLLLATSAIETLCSPSKSGTEHNQVVERLIGHLDQMEVSSQVRATLKSALNSSKRQSIRQACLSKLKTGLGEATAKEFDKLYKLRSSFVHEGRGRGGLAAAASRVQKIARDLLEADLKTSKGEEA